MQTISFSKLNGQGNDFIIIDATEKAYNLSEDVIALMCDRHFGIGADGLILVKKSGSADFFMDYYNKDGSAAEMCGNGIRCMSRFIIENDLWDKESLNIDTRAGIKKIKINLNKKTKSVEEIKVNMGRPLFDPKKIPVDIDPVEHGNEKFLSNYPLMINSREFKINCVSMGNPHCIVFLDKREDLSTFPLDVFGPEFENHQMFPKKTNAEFVKITGDNEISMRVWERGVGETLACGTGACAAAVCSIMLAKVKGPEVSVKLSGGYLNIFWDGGNKDVFLEGEVGHSFDGNYILKP